MKESPSMDDKERARRRHLSLAGKRYWRNLPPDERRATLRRMQDARKAKRPLPVSPEQADALTLPALQIVEETLSPPLPSLRIVEETDGPGTGAATEAGAGTDEIGAGAETGTTGETGAGAETGTTGETGAGVATDTRGGHSRPSRADQPKRVVVTRKPRKKATETRSAAQDTVDTQEAVERHIRQDGVVAIADSDGGPRPSPNARAPDDGETRPVPTPSPPPVPWFDPRGVDERLEAVERRAAAGHVLLQEILEGVRAVRTAVADSGATTDRNVQALSALVGREGVRIEESLHQAFRERLTAVAGMVGELRDDGRRVRDVLAAVTKGVAFLVADPMLERLKEALRTPTPPRSRRG
jgi:hypothetical protein